MASLPALPTYDYNAVWHVAMQRDQMQTCRLSVQTGYSYDVVPRDRAELKLT